MLIKFQNKLHTLVTHKTSIYLRLPIHHFPCLCSNSHDQDHVIYQFFGKKWEVIVGVSIYLLNYIKLGYSYRDFVTQCTNTTDFYCTQVEIKNHMDNIIFFRAKIDDFPCSWWRSTSPKSFARNTLVCRDHYSAR